MGRAVVLVLKKKNKLYFSPFHQCQEKWVLFFPTRKKKKTMGSIPHEPRILLMTVSALGIFGWAVLTTKLDVHNCQKNGQGTAASPSASCMLSAAPRIADVGSAGVLGLTFPESTRGSPTQGLTEIQDHLPVSGSNLAWLV